METRKALKRVVSSCLGLLMILGLIPGIGESEAHAFSASGPGEKRLLMVSAYYSPLPDQRFYMRGSYEGDIRLNGRGTNGADGTEVYVGMIAAPKNFPFGTRIHIPGLGVGEVHDRGGAIRSYTRYDRIDVWMGYGEEGLSRALNWGMRLVDGEIWWKALQVQPGLSFAWVSSQLPASTLDRLMSKTLLNPSAFTKPITANSSTTDIRELQEALRVFGYYHGSITGVFDGDTREAVLMFQLAEGVIRDEKETGAGTFGPKTRIALKSKAENFNSRFVKEQRRLTDNLAELSVNLGKNSSGEEVSRVQQMLWELGYFKGSFNGKYDSVTMDAVFRFQKDNGILENDWESGAGYFGKQTFEAMVAAVDRRMEKLKEFPDERQLWVPAKVPLPSLVTLRAEMPDEERNPLAFGLKAVVFNTPCNPLFSETLRLNDRGAQVKALQDVLIRQTHLDKGLNTGFFGLKTEEALVQFQLAHGIIQRAGDSGSGVTGPRTRAALNGIH
jgi:peptidoglycan hydrolase-like protein with peptidoglycan-binding domain/3D (Asp-Asp-Asp) domain-containing protein